MERQSIWLIIAVLAFEAFQGEAEDLRLPRPFLAFFCFPFPGPSGVFVSLFMCHPTLQVGGAEVATLTLLESNMAC